MKTLKATVSGSFTRHIEAIQRAVAELNRRGVRVLSPERPTIVDELDGFLFVESDRHRLVRLVQDRHLASIRSSNFLWLEASDGYVGPSAALELGFAIASGVPVYSTTVPADLTMRQYVQRVPNIESAIAAVSSNPPCGEPGAISLLVDPIAVTDLVADSLTQIRKVLMAGPSANDADALTSVLQQRERITAALDVPVVLTP